MHRTRSEMPKAWPIARKGTKYLAVASHSKSDGISLLFVLREMLKLARTRKEVKYILRNKDVKVNNKVRIDENFPLQVFDVISLDKLGKHYRITLSAGKFKLEEVSAKEAEKKIVKIIGKKNLNAKEVQMNLEDGHNFISKEKFALGDSILLNTKENKVEKILVLKEGAKVEIVGGKYSGEQGKIKATKELSRGKEYLVKLNDKEVTLPLKTLLVIE